VPGFLFLKRSTFMLTSEKKQKYPQIAQQFWVYACYEQILGKTRQRNPAVQNSF